MKGLRDGGEKFSQIAPEAGPVCNGQQYQQNGQRYGHGTGGGVNQGGQQLGPDELVPVYRQGEHQVALVGHVVLIEPIDHQQRRDGAGGHYEDPERHIQQPHQDGGGAGTVRMVCRQLVKQAAAAGGGQQQGINRQQDAAGGPKLIFQQFTQHNGTPPETDRLRCSHAPAGSGPRTGAAPVDPG